MENEKTISLQGGEYFLTEEMTSAYRVLGGTAFLYIVPLREKEIGRRSFLYEIKAGEVIPGFCHQDMDYCQWRFCIVPVEAVSIQIIPHGSTRILRERFVKKAELKNYEKEGFEGSLVDRYRKNIVVEDGFIRRSQKRRTDAAEHTKGLIRNAFRKTVAVPETERTGNRLYDAMAVLCAERGISVAPYEKVKEVCGEGGSTAEIARLSHFAYRQVLLTEGWEQADGGSLLVFDEKKKPYACLPKKHGGYLLYDTEKETLTPVTKALAAALNPEAYVIYRPLPEQAGRQELVRFCKKSIRRNDMVLLFVLTVVTALIELLLPTISSSLYDTYIPLGAKTILFQIGCLMGAFLIANILFGIVKNLVNFRIISRMSCEFQTAAYDRLFNLPESFYRDYESADLAQRVMGAGTLAGTIGSAVLMTAVSLVFSLICLGKMIGYSGKLAGIGIGMTGIYGLLYYMVSVRALNYKKKAVELEGKTGSMMYQFLNGIAKLRIAGVEDRALYEYMKPYVSLRNCEEQKRRILSLGETMNLVSGSVFAMILYLVIMKGNMTISLGSFIGFQTIFGTFTASALQLVQALVQIRSAGPELERLKPVLENRPEFEEACELPGELSGAVEINNVSFRYSVDAPMVLSDLSLNIRAGEYIGIVGTSGCGKSTLLKLLLGFEKPVSGKIYYDNKDIDSLDKRELRKKMGVVLQDGKLISGSIYENITITAPEATLKDVERVVEAVGLKKDIAAMPMGLHTVLSEDCGTISGGQQQRILIARAIISNPKILLFDEATSALDNVTQSMVCDTLEAMDSTRIVIAHRLSTVIRCDRILVLDRGTIAEQGTYEELMEKKGLFYDLASRQIQ